MSDLKTQEVDDVLIVGFSDAKLLDAAVIQQVGNDLQAIASEATEDKKILLTFHGVGFMSSAMLGKLVLFLKICKQKGAKLKVCSISPEIFEIFKITKLNKMFDVQKDEKSAMESFKKKGWFS